MNPRRFQVTGAKVCYVSVVAGGATGAVCGVQRLAKRVHFISHVVCSFHAHVIACSLFFSFLFLVCLKRGSCIMYNRDDVVVLCAVFYCTFVFFPVFTTRVYVEVL